MVHFHVQWPSTIHDAMAHTGGFYRKKTFFIRWIQEFRTQATHDGLGGAIKILRNYNSL
jgi:hypothetical protein